MKWLTPAYLVWTYLAINTLDIDPGNARGYLFAWVLSTLWMGKKVAHLWLLEKIIKQGNAIYPLLSPAEAAQIQATPPKSPSFRLLPSHRSA